MKSVFLDFATLGSELATDALHETLPGVEIFDETSTAEISDRISGAAVVMANKARFSATVLRNSPDLKLIALVATGTDNINLQAARELGIAVCNIRDYCTQSVAEHVIGCLLNLTHKLDRYNLAVRDGAWQDASNFCMLNYPIRELGGMTLGVVGYGYLGNGVARMARALGMDVIVAARRGAKVVADDRVSFDELLEHADVISLHCPLDDTTAGLFSAREFRAMRSDAILINTARGGLVDSAALVDALRDGEIAAAAIDVLPQEPPVDGDPLLDYDAPNLMVTPHIAWATRTARQAALDQMVSNVSSFLAGGAQNRVV